MTHSKCTGSTYIEITPRGAIPYIDWKTQCDYHPLTYNSPLFYANKPPVWADPVDISKIDWTTRPHYVFDKNGYPQNPVGRTGIVGRGILGKWGENTAGDPLITRWKRDKDNNIVMLHNMPVMQFVAIERTDGGDGGDGKYALPGGMVDKNELITYTIAREFSEEALGS